jgi:hypothetical protein
MVYLRTLYWREYLDLRQRKWQEAENLYDGELHNLCLPSVKCMEWLKVSASDSVQPKHVTPVWICTYTVNSCSVLWILIQWSPYFLFPLFAFYTILHTSCKVPARCPQEQCYIFLDFKFPQLYIFWNLYSVFLILTIKIYLFLCFTVLFSESIVESRHLWFICREYEISCVDQL